MTSSRVAATSIGDRLLRRLETGCCGLAGSFGFQAGADASEIVLLAMTDRGVAALLSTSVKLAGRRCLTPDALLSPATGNGPPVTRTRSAAI